MILISLILFLFAALLGIFLLSYLLRNKNTPKGVALIHGFIAAAGLVLLIISAFSYHPPLTSIFLFFAAAMGGFILMYRDLTGKTLPKWLALGHGSIALLGFVVLLIFFMG